MIVRVVFGILIAISVILAAAFSLSEPTTVYNLIHDVYPTMRRAGAGVERPVPELWIGWAFGSLQIALFVALLALGTWKHVKRSGLGSWLLVCGALYLLVWALLVVTYVRYRGGIDVALVLEFPLPTAIMLFVLWPFPLVFILLYTFGFKRWIFTDDDERTFQRLLSERRSLQEIDE